MHGGRAVVADVCDALVHLGLRPAEPGEFTRRAFMNGRMDLTQAEAVADLVDAETEAQRRQALRQLDGALGEVFRDWAVRLTNMLAQQEALIDFPDEDLPLDVEAQAEAALGALIAEMTRHLEDGRRGERLRDGLVFAIAGPVNSGKSTLMNALARREVAIVSPQPGTTRDVLEARLDLGGAVVTLLDTAGLRESDDPVEAEGVRRAMTRLRGADVVLNVAPAGSPWIDIGAVDGRVIHVSTKIDLATTCDPSALAVSAQTGDGMDALTAVLAAQARDLTETLGSPPLTRARHRAALAEAVACLEAAEHATMPELRAEDLRLALRAIGRITGHVGVEVILDSVFRQFCIGK